jgi:hypothetical protein
MPADHNRSTGIDGHPADFGERDRERRPVGGERLHRKRCAPHTFAALAVVFHYHDNRRRSGDPSNRDDRLVWCDRHAPTLDTRNTGEAWV